MKVKEKEFLGYFDYQGEFLYFDEDGTAALKTNGSDSRGAVYRGIGA